MFSNIQNIIDQNSIYVQSPLMPKEPIVTVLLWTYNHINYLRAAVESVLNQKTAFNVEIVISDDCSTDGTTELVKEYQLRYSEKVRIILSLKNLFPYGVIGIRAVHAARGKYVAFLEGDDYWTDPLKLQKQVDVLEANPNASAVFHDTMVLDALTGRTKAKRHYGLVQGQLAYGQQDTVRNSVLCHTSSILFRRESIIPLPKWMSQVASGDMGIYFLCGCKGSLLRIPEFMSTYRKHPGGITNSGMHDGRLLHYNRIRLFLFCRRHLGHKAIELDWSCFDQHVGGVIGHHGLRRQIVNLLRAIQESPRLVFHPLLFRLFIRHTIKRQQSHA